jgi:hypothetical protein
MYLVVFIPLKTCLLCVSMPVKGQCYVNIYRSMLVCVHCQVYLSAVMWGYRLQRGVLTGWLVKQFLLFNTNSNILL